MTIERIKNPFLTRHGMFKMAREIVEIYEEKKTAGQEPEKALNETVNTIIEKYSYLRPERHQVNKKETVITGPYIFGSIKATLNGGEIEASINTKDDRTAEHESIIGEIGQTVAVSRLKFDLERDKEGVLYGQIVRALHQYIKGNWGVLCEEDAEENDNAVKYEEVRILARYEIPEHEDIYIITEWDRSVTTILYVSDY